MFRQKLWFQSPKTFTPKTYFEHATIVHAHVSVHAYRRNFFWVKPGRTIWQHFNLAIEGAT